MLLKRNSIFKLSLANSFVFAFFFVSNLSYANDQQETYVDSEGDIEVEYEKETIEIKSKSYNTISDKNFFTESKVNKKAKTGAEERYEKSSVAEKTLHDITNYGEGSKNPYKIENYAMAKTDVLSDANLKAKERENSETKFYIALQGNLFLPDSFDLKEPKYFGATLPTLPNSNFDDAFNFLPNGTRTGTYAKMSSDNVIVYPYISLGIRTNNNFRFEIAHMQTKFKLKNDNGESGENPLYTSGYDVLSRNINMDFNQQIYLLNGYVDLKFNRVWVYFGAGIGAVNNQLKSFTASIENASKTETYILESLTDKKSVYKSATMLAFGTYFKIFDGAFIDIGVKKISAGKISTLKDYNLTKIINAAGTSISEKISMNFLEAEIDPYLVNIGLRFEF